MVKKPVIVARNYSVTSPVARKRPLKRPESSTALKRKADTSGHDRPAKARRTRDEDSDGPVYGPVVTADPEGPTPGEWRRMKINTKLVVADDDKKCHDFHVGDFVQVLPEDATQDDIPELEWSQFWVGCIREMRSRKKEGMMDSEAWVQVQWLYSPDDVSTLRAKEIKARLKKPYQNVSRFSPYERFWSSHKDVISALCLNDVIRVYDFREADVDAPPIPPETIFIRYNLDTHTGHFSPASTSRNKAAHNCACGTPYNTGDPSERLRFCPRPACRRAYHESCLDPYPTAGFADTRALFLTSHPHKNRPVDMRGEPRDMPPQSSGGKGKGKGRGKGAIKASAIYDAEGQETQEVAELLPERLLSLAGRPIVRGGGRGGGVAGNVHAVCRARLKVYEIASTGLPDDDWEDEFVDALAEDDALIEEEEEGEGELTVYQCPRCVGPI
ncbi:hypothetical protein HDZ31DRAFT_30113 [Schizophyllum fasciatum]